MSLPVPEILAVVVNYNAGELLAACIESLLEQAVSLEVLVLDNASDDHSARSAQKRFENDPRVRFEFSPVNLGFAAGVNRAVAAAGGEAEKPPNFLLVINPDCMAGHGAVATLLGALCEHPGAGVAGPRVVDPRGTVQRATLRRFPDPWNALKTFSGRAGGVDLSEKLPDRASYAEAVSGACMMMRFELFQRLGGFDEAYGLHCEDLDLMNRATQAGWPCLIVPGAVVVHHQGRSSRSRPVWVHWQKHRGMQRYFEKFQQDRYHWPVRLMVRLGIWARFALTLPFQWLRK